MREGHGIPNLDQVEIDEEPTAEAYLQQTARAHVGSLEVIAIGPLTNLANALTADREVRPAVRQLSDQVVYETVRVSDQRLAASDGRAPGDMDPAPRDPHSPLSSLGD